MCHLVINLLSLLAKHDIGEVVILVDDEVHRDVERTRDSGNHDKFVGTTFLLEKFLNEIFRIVISIFSHKGIKHKAQILVELLLQFVYRASNLREVEVHHLVSSHQWRGVLAYPKRSEYLFKPVLFRLVVVGLKHTQKQALAKAARADEHEVVRLLLKHRYIHGLVNVIKVGLHYVLKVRHPVRQLLDVVHIYVLSQ